MIDDAFPEIHPEQKAQISSTIAATVILPQAYKSFKDIFSVKNAVNLSPHKDYDYAIDLIDE